MNDDRDPLFWRSPDEPAALLGLAGVEFRVTAWGTLDGQFDLLEVIDERQALLRLQQLLDQPQMCSLRTETGVARNIAHHPDPRGHWEVEPLPGESLAVGCYFAAPPGRMALDAEFALPGAEHAGSLYAAIRPLSIVIDPGNEPMLMIAGPQHLPADEDERLLAHTFCGLLRDCHQIPLPPSEDLQLLLWRRLTTAPERATPLRAPKYTRRPRGVVNIHGEEVNGEHREDADWREPPDQQPIRRCVGTGVRCWRLARSLRDHVARELREIADTPLWPELVRAEGDSAPPAGEED